MTASPPSDSGILGFKEEQVIAMQRKSLTALELLIGLGLGPVAALLYPELRALSATLQRGDQKFCLEVMGVCGGVPLALQDFFKSTVGLLFGFLLGYTFFFLLARQEKLYNALFEEAEVLTQLLEESQLLLPRQTVLQVVRCVKSYLSTSWCAIDQTPAEIYVRVLKEDKDPIEELSRILILDAARAEGSRQVLAVVQQLRTCRARRLAGLQRVIPSLQFFILGTLAVLAAVPPFLDGSSDSSALSQVLYGVLVSVLALVMFAVQDLSDPARGFYSSEAERYQILGALEETLDWIEADAGGGAVARARGMPSAPGQERRARQPGQRPPRESAPG